MFLDGGDFHVFNLILKITRPRYIPPLQVKKMKSLALFEPKMNMTCLDKYQKQFWTNSLVYSNHFVQLITTFQLSPNQPISLSE